MANDPTARALRLLSLLQTHRLWRAADLARRLGVTERTVRRDVDRLRDLGYPVDAVPGSHGGYRLAAGAHLPPLLFDDGEAVAVAVGLRAAAGAAIAGIEETSVRALAKIQQVLPDRLKRRVSALHANVASMPWEHGDDGVVDPDAITVLATACRDHEQVRFDYRRRDGDDSRRLVEPHQLVTVGRRWYLVAWDVRRTDWRTFRLDRLGGVQSVRTRFAPREVPGGDGAAYVAASIASTPLGVEATIALGEPLDRVAEALSALDHTLIDARADSCTVRLRADRMEWLVMAVVRLALEAPLLVVEPRAVADEIGALIGRLGRR
ncbi:helix-turn-helix transcriptional regulator [Agromyces sp. SYSU T0242]|uniref:helix-turn-helix transcriptional regulator n=1 Tax=Agromyces litoreus TaxID=3158561 RepID=UPI0033941B97